MTQPKTDEIIRVDFFLTFLGPYFYLLKEIRFFLSTLISLMKNR